MKSIFPTKWTQALCIIAGVYAIIVASYLFVETGKKTGARDFHQYWYAGHFVLQGHDPYQAFFEGEQPELPIKYLDGVTVNQYPVAQGNLELVPTNTPVMVLLLTPFAYFSWSLAKWMFLIVNLSLIGGTGWLVLRGIPFTGKNLAPMDELLIFLVYFDLSATRIATENGQTTLLVFLCMLLALAWAKQSWVRAGLALGVALSKYSVSLPVFLFFLYKRKFHVLSFAIAVQMIGVLGLAAIARTSPVTIVGENVRLFIEIFNQSEGYVHLASQFQRLTTNPLLLQIPVVVMTVLVFAASFLWLRGRKSTASSTDDVVDFHILTILFFWTILAGYHRLYDSLILVVFIVLLFKGLADPQIWKLNHRERMVVLSFLAAIPPILIIPARLTDKVIPHYYGWVGNAVFATFFIAMMVLTMILLRRYLYIRRAEMTSETVKHFHFPQRTLIYSLSESRPSNPKQRIVIQKRGAKRH